MADENLAPRWSWDQAFRDAEAILDGPCPICGGIEGCSDTREERLRAFHAKARGETE
jgi:hypothetical protein